MGWDRFTNGDLIAAAEAGGFDVLITCDQRIRYQQNLSGRRIALVVLTAVQWPVVRGRLLDIQAAVDASSVGSYLVVTFDRRALRRRAFNPKPEC
jgi:hypothetical protein